MQFNVGMLLTKRSQLEPDKLGLVFEGRAFTFRELNERCNRWAHASADLGMEKGDRVGILLKNCNEFLEAYFGLAKVGAILLPLNWRQAPPELEYICRDSEIRTLIYGEEFTQTVETIRPKLRIQEYLSVGQSTPVWGKSLSFINQFSPSEPKTRASGGDPALILYTSGTTGRPKGVVMTHENAFWLSTNCLLTFDFRSEDRLLNVLPLFHIGGLVPGALADVYKGCTTVLMKEFEPLKMLETIQTERINSFLAVATMLQRLAQVPDFENYLSTVRWLLVGGGLPASLMRTYTRLGIKVWQIYAATEAGCGLVIDAEKGMQKPGSAGLAFFHHEVRVVDEKGDDVAPGQVGEILVKGPTVMKEYWNNQQATRETIKDGWFHSGDLARIDEDGYIYIVDRKKDMIKSGGENIYPAEVENVLQGHPKIVEVCVIGHRDEVWGESVCAVIRPRAGETLTLKEVTDFCQDKLARFKLPKCLVLREQPLPRNAAGKVLKRVLREEYATG